MERFTDEGVFTMLEGKDWVLTVPNGFDKAPWPLASEAGEKPAGSKRDMRRVRMRQNHHTGTQHPTVNRTPGIKNKQTHTSLILKYTTYVHVLYEFLLR